MLAAGKGDADNVPGNRTFARALQPHQAWEGFERKLSIRFAKTRKRKRVVLGHQLGGVGTAPTTAAALSTSAGPLHDTIIVD